MHTVYSFRGRCSACRAMTSRNNFVKTLFVEVQIPHVRRPFQCDSPAAAAPELDPYPIHEPNLLALLISDFQPFAREATQPGSVVIHPARPSSRWHPLAVIAGLRLTG